MKHFLPSQMQALLYVFSPFLLCFVGFGPSIFSPAVLKIAQEPGKIVFWVDSCTQSSWGKASACLLPRLGAGAARHPSLPSAARCHACPDLPLRYLPNVNEMWRCDLCLVFSPRLSHLQRPFQNDSEQITRIQNFNLRAVSFQEETRRCLRGGVSPPSTACAPHVRQQHPLKPL